MNYEFARCVEILMNGGVYFQPENYYVGVEENLAI